MSLRSPVTLIHEDSLLKRFLAKLLGSFLSIFFTFLQHGIAPRLLGPGAYGDFCFIKSFFDSLFGFFDTGTSTVFYKKISQNPHNNLIKTFYWRLFIFFNITALNLFLFIFLFNINNYLWPHYSFDILLLGFLLGSTYWASQIINKITDAYGLTVYAETWKVLQRAILAFFIFSLFIFQLNSLKTFLIIQIIACLLLSLGWIFLLKKHNHTNFCLFYSLSKRRTKNFIRSYWRACSPIIIFALASFLSLTFDRWLLQFFYGSEAQGFFGLAFQVSSFCFLFSSSFSSLFMRDFSKKVIESPGNCAQFLRRTLFIFYTITAYFSAFIYTNANFIVEFIGGDAFSQSIPIVLILVFYPLHQTYGQICGNVLYATNKTKIYRNISLFYLVTGIGISFILITPKDFYGLGLGGEGLALKFIFIQLITTNSLLFFICRYFCLKAIPFLLHQVVILALFLGLSFIVKIFSSDSLFGLLRSGIVYTILSLLTIYFFPFIVSSKKEDFLSIFIKKD